MYSRQKAKVSGTVMQSCIGMPTGWTSEVVKRCGKEWPEERGPCSRKGYISPGEESGLYPEGSGKSLP